MLTTSVDVWGDSSNTTDTQQETNNWVQNAITPNNAFAIPSLMDTTMY